MKIRVINKFDFEKNTIQGVFEWNPKNIQPSELALSEVEKAENYDIFSKRISEVIEKYSPKKNKPARLEFERKIKIFGKDIIEESAIKQMENCLVSPNDIGVMTADGHHGYGHPIGGAIAYENYVSLSGVGFDIGCGNKAVRTNIKSYEFNVKKVMEQIAREIGFGVGRPNPNEVIDHEIFDKIARADFAPQRNFLKLAQEQLGTVGSGNHFIDLFTDEDDFVWIGVHFGSRGFGHKTTTGFLALHQGMEFTDRASEKKDADGPVLFDVNTQLGQDYISAVQLAGEYATAGRDVVVDKVLNILGAKAKYSVHNHHNFVWHEEHFGKKFWVVRKGCTPAFPGQQGFIGANMHDVSVIVEGVDSQESREGLYSTVHGAGRVLSRTKAAGKGKWQKMGKNRKKVITSPGIVNWKQVKQNMAKANIVLMGAGADEAPECYKNLEEVLSYQGNTIKVLHRLFPIGVAMADNETYDPYKDA